MHGILNKSTMMAAVMANELVHMQCELFDYLVYCRYLTLFIQDRIKNSINAKARKETFFFSILLSHVESM